MHELDDRPRRAAAVAVQLPDVADGELAESLIELRRLGKTLGIPVTTQVTQKRDHFDPGAYVGTGKRAELKQLVESGSVDTILVDHELTPSQTRNLEKETGAEVFDRTFVILEIFQRHAHSRAACAQVEIVRLQYLAPRLREAGKGKGNRQRGGIGGKGVGESKVELDRRKIRDRIAELTLELEALEQERATRRSRRKDTRRVARVMALRRVVPRVRSPALKAARPASCGCSQTVPAATKAVRERIGRSRRSIRRTLIPLGRRWDSTAKCRLMPRLPFRRGPAPG